MRRLLRWRRDHPDETDRLAAAVLSAVAVAAWIGAHFAPRSDLHRYDLGIGGLVLALVQTVPVAWRRRAPVPAFVVSAASLALTYALGYLPTAGDVALALLAYGVGAHSDRNTSIRVLTWGSATAAVVVIYSMAAGHNVGSMVPHVVVFATVGILGDNLRNRRDYLRGLQERAERLEREREQEAERAVQDERTRIARELHDVVAHSVSVMVVQAGAARRVLSRDPGRAAEALSSVEGTGRQALEELRRLLGVLRTRDEPAGDLTPQPGIADLEALVRQMVDAGLQVLLDVEGEPRPLPSGLDLTAYRIVQEALTNTLKHAGPARAHVTLRYGPRALEVKVTYDGRGVAVVGAGGPGGHGLVGMRERVALYGGRLRAGPRRGGGFEVLAVLQTEPDRPRPTPRGRARAR